MSVNKEFLSFYIARKGILGLRKSCFMSDFSFLDQFQGVLS
jgi:hypothetical protein